LEHKHEPRLDTLTPSPASTGHSQVASLDEIDGAKVA
jgi:hypothetical protein